MKGGRADLAIVTGALLLYVGLAVASARHHAATFDEGSHLPAGYTYLALGDYRMNPEHPPAIKLLAALPLQLLPVRVETDDLTWPARRQWEFGRRFLYRWNDADLLLFCGRLPIIGLGALLGLLVFHWARRLDGSLTAGLALLLCVLSPDLLAHGSVVTTDVGIALFSFASVVALARFRDGITPGRAAVFAATCALAFATKYSALLFVPILVLLGTVVAVNRDPVVLHWRGAKGRLESPRRRAGVLLLIALLTVVTTYGVLWAAYGFRYHASPDGQPPLPWTNVVPESVFVRAPAWIALQYHLLPEALVLGFLRFFKASEARPSFLFGEISPDGFWYYFPATFAIKTPLPLLLLLVTAAVQAWRSRGDRVREAFLWLPPIAYMALVMMRSLNIGHRHLLPLYPYLFILAARAAARGWRSGRTSTRGVVVVLLVWYGLGTLWIHPHYLSYFNELVGGPRNGYRSLADSNVDWGQDLKELKAWMDRERVPEIKLAYFGSADPDYYGIRNERLPGELRPPRLASRIHAGDVVAISATHLAGVYLSEDARRLMQRFQAETPMARVGYSILIYRAREEYDVPGASGPAEP
jgi:hypothetical protein